MNSDEDAKETTTEKGNSDGTPSPPRNGIAKHRGGNDDGEDHNNRDNDRNNTNNTVVKDNAQPVNDGTAEGELHPYVQVLRAVMNLMKLLSDILSTVVIVYLSPRENLFSHYWDWFDQENATEAQRQMASRAAVVLLNLLRYFNPQRYAAGMDQMLEYKDYPVSVVTRLMDTLDHVLDYILTRGRPLFDELLRLYDRLYQIVIQLQPSEALSEGPLLDELQDFQRRLVVFVREVVNPELLLLLDGNNNHNNTTATDSTVSDIDTTSHRSGEPHSPNSKQQQPGQGRHQSD